MMCCKYNNLRARWSMDDMIQKTNVYQVTRITNCREYLARFASSEIWWTLQFTDENVKKCVLQMRWVANSEPWNETIQTHCQVVRVASGALAAMIARCTGARAAAACSGTSWQGPGQRVNDARPRSRPLPALPCRLWNSFWIVIQ